MLFAKKSNTQFASLLTVEALSAVWASRYAVRTVTALFDQLTSVSDVYVIVVIFRKLISFDQCSDH
jgi:hypothetical protein